MTQEAGVSSWGTRHPLRDRTEGPSLTSGCTEAGEAQAIWKESIGKACLLGPEEAMEAIVDRVRIQPKPLITFAVG